MFDTGGLSTCSSRSKEETLRNLVRIGAGSFATVLVCGGMNYAAIKQVADIDRTPELQREFATLQDVYERCSSPRLLFQLPEPHSYHNDWQDFARIKRLPEDAPGQCVYVMERVWPVPPQLKADIMSRYFSPEQQQLCGDKSFIARIYLGRRSEPSRAFKSRFFNQNNFPLYTDRLQELGLPVKELAVGMGCMLSRIHHFAGTDGRDIEFVVGGSPKQQASFWCIDFNQVQGINLAAPLEEKVKQLVDSFYINDPYYPRPDMDYWDDFKAAYLHEAPCSNPGLS